MDQTDKAHTQPDQTPVPNHPESLKGSQMLSNNPKAPSVDQPISEKRVSQNASQNGSRSISQTGSQMDQQILGGLSKKQKRRYTTFLEALGIDVQGGLSKKQDQPIYDASDAHNQQIEPRSLSQQFQQPIETFIEEAHLNNQGFPQKDHALNGGNHILVENNSEFGQIQASKSQKSVKSLNLGNHQNFISNSHELENQSPFHQDLQSNIFEGQGEQFNGQNSKNLQKSENTEEGQIFFENSHQTHEDQKNEVQNHVFQSPSQQMNHNQQEAQLKATSKAPQNHLHSFSNYQSEDGQISMENNFDPFSNSKPLSEINYDVINSIYTPVSHFKVPTKNPDQIHLEENSNAFSNNQQLTIVMEEFRHLVEEEKDVEIDGTYPLEMQKDVEMVASPQFSETKDVEIDGPSLPYQNYEQKDVEIDGPSPQFQNFYQNNNYERQILEGNQTIQTEQKDFEIDGPSYPHQLAPENDIEIDRQSSIYPFSEANVPISNQYFSDDFVDRPNPPMQIQVEEKPSLHVISETSKQMKVQEKEDQNFYSHEANQSSSCAFEPSTNIIKPHSQSHQKDAVFTKPKKNSLSLAFQNKDLNRTAQGHINRRKFSESSRSAGLNSVNNKVTSNKRSDESSEKNQASFVISQNIFDSREFSCFQTSHDRIVSIEEQNEPHESIKMTPNQNSFSNRSDKSVKSKRSNRFSDELVNQKQVPPLDSLQLIKDGKEPRLERRSRSSDNSNRSNGSRSASTCKKSYDDLSDIHMEKIDEKIGEELEEKSIKRSIHPLSYPALTVQQAQSQKLELDNEIFEATQNREAHFNTEDVQIDGKPVKIHQSHTDFEFRNDSIQTNYIRHQEQRKSPERKENFAQTVSHQITIHFDQQKQNEIKLETKSVQYDIFSEASSKKTTQSQKMRQRDEYLESERKHKMNKLRLVPVLQIQIDRPLPIDVKVENVLVVCKKYLTSPNFQRSNFKQILETNFEKNFDYFGPLKPISDLGEVILHDGIFACSFINFVKLARNSPMMESLMFTQFDEEVGIWTNTQFFMTELKRVKEEREMHYNNEFEKRLKEYEERKAKEEARKMNMTTKVVNQTVKQQNVLLEPKMSIKKKEQNVQQEPKMSMKKKQQKSQTKKQKIFEKPNPIVSRVFASQVIIEESIGSVAGSSETMTVVEDIRDLSISPIRKSTISELGPKENSSIVQEGEDISNSFSLESANLSSLNPIKEDKKPQNQKLIPPKKRVTKKREKKNEESAVIKSEHLEVSLDQSVSQVLQISQNKSKQKNPNVEADGKLESFKDKKPTKGILKGSRILKSKDEPSSKQKYKKRSPSKKELEKVSKKKKPQVSKEKQTKNSKSPVNKRLIRNLDTDVEESNKSETRSPAHKISIQKAVEQKMNQGKAVKFTSSTKGGQKNSNNQSRRNPRIFETLSEDQSQQSIPEKRVLRSRSKK